MRAENFVFKGKFIVNSTDIQRLYKMINGHLIDVGYRQSGSWLFGTILSTKYYLLTVGDTSVPLHLKIKQLLKLQTEQEVNTLAHIERLNKIRNDIPYEISVSLFPEKINDKDVTAVEVVSKSCMYQKMAQMYLKGPVSEETISLINVENTLLIQNICRSVLGQMVETPKALEFFIDTQAIQILQTFGFNSVSDMLLKGRRKLETGDSSGLDDLRGAIENFFYILVDKIGSTPESLQNPERNISKIGIAGYIDSEYETLIRTILYNQIYLTITDKKTHKRQDIDLLTSRLFFDVTESTMIYLCTRILKYKMKTDQVKQDN
jgi:hypothetical protein